MDHHRSSTLLDEALALDWTQPRVIVIEDCVETNGAFVLHHVLKRSLALHTSSTSAVIFLAFSQPFSHYDRILRKLGCNLAMQKDNKRFVFFNLLTLECPDGDEGKTSGGLPSLYREIQKVIIALHDENRKSITIMIDDISLMEVAANGSTNHVLDFLHYCHTLTLEFGCLLVTVNHGDIYSSMERPALLLQMEYLADILIKAEPLSTGLATDVHGQLTVLNKGICEGQGNPRNRTHNFHFKVKENSVECFYPGTRT